jgi:carbon monoxide dehydrogenase subunit G
MEFENHFAVDVPIDEVWAALLDIERVAPAVPGARVVERTSDHAYKVAIKVRVGPMSMTYNGEVEITDRDEEAHRAVMKARARESRGQGTANANVTMMLTGENGRTSATVKTDVELSGKVATLGHGVLKDVSGRLVGSFAENLAAMLEGEQQPADEVPARPTVERMPEAEPGGDDALDLGSLGGAAIMDQLKDPRRLAILLALLAVVAYLLGRARG